MPTTNPTLLSQDCTGRWESTTEISLEQCVGGAYQTRSRGLLIVESPEQAADLLSRGFQIRYGREWYQCVKRPRTPAELADLQARRARPFVSTEQQCNVEEH